MQAGARRHHGKRRGSLMLTDGSSRGGRRRTGGAIFPVQGEDHQVREGEEQQQQQDEQQQQRDQQLRPVRRGTTRLQRNAEVKESFNAVVYSLVGSSALLCVGSWTLAFLGETGGWLPRILFPVEVALFLAHFGVTAEEGGYVSQLWFAHVIFVFFVNGVAGLAWWGSTPVHLRAGVGWLIFFTVLIMIGILFIVLSVVFRNRAFPVRFYIIACYRARLGDYAIECFTSCFGGVLPFQILTIAQFVAECAKVVEAAEAGSGVGAGAHYVVNTTGGGSGGSVNLSPSPSFFSSTTPSPSPSSSLSLPSPSPSPPPSSSWSRTSFLTSLAAKRLLRANEDSMCSAMGYAAFGSSTFVMWLFMLNTGVMPTGIRLRHVLTGNAQPSAAYLFAGTALAVPFAGVLVIAGLTGSRIFSPAAVEWSFGMMIGSLVGPFVYAIVVVAVLNPLFGTAVSAAAGSDEDAERKHVASLSGAAQERSVDLDDPAQREPEYWPGFWDNDVVAGNFGAVLLVREEGKDKDERKVYGFLEICVEPVVEAEVEADKCVHEFEGCEREVVKRYEEVIAWLNAREKAGNPWPHDEAYCYQKRHECHYRIYRIHGRREDDNGGENENDENNNNNNNNNSNNDALAAALTTLRQQHERAVETIAAQAATIKALERWKTRQETAFTAAVARIAALEAREETDTGTVA